MHFGPGRMDGSGDGIGEDTSTRQRECAWWCAYTSANPFVLRSFINRGKTEPGVWVGGDGETEVGLTITGRWWKAHLTAWQHGGDQCSGGAGWKSSKER
eukprot:6206704-Pleurochrysis_carterae.AAC.3